VDRHSNPLKRLGFARSIDLGVIDLGVIDLLDLPG
jgi:hypothetical protein